MKPRGDHDHLSDFELALRSVEVAAERARVEGEELRRFGFRPVGVAGLGSALWGRRGRLFTTRAALEEIGVIPEQREDRT